MAILRLRKYGDPVLREQAAPVEKFDDELRDLVDDMIETMQVENGIGLAAPQIGLSLALCVVDVGLIDETRTPQAYVNPEVLQTAGDDVDYEEGCLSIPGVSEDVTRKDQIVVRYQDLDGETHQEEVDGMLSRVLQHEIDHLNGKLFIDYLGTMRRAMIAKKLRALAVEAQKELLAARSNEV